MHPTLFKKGDKIFACDKCEKKFEYIFNVFAYETNGLSINYFLL